MFQMRVISRAAVRRIVRQLQGICEHAVRDKGELVLGIQDRNQLQDARLSGRSVHRPQGPSMSATCV